MITAMEEQLEVCNVKTDQTEECFTGAEKDSLMTGVNQTSL